MSCILGLALHEHGHTARVLSLCTIGFFVACVWIITIVNEVVGVLQVSYRCRVPDNRGLESVLPLFRPEEVPSGRRSTDLLRKSTGGDRG